MNDFEGKIEVLDEKVLWHVEFGEIYFRILLRTVQKQKLDGSMDSPRKFIIFDRGNSVCALILLKDKVKGDRFILVRQYRGGSNSYDWELPAGMKDGNETSMKAVEREVLEETGFKSHCIFEILRLKLSPGAASETADIFYAVTSLGERTEQGGGRIEEWEDIEVMFVPVREAIEMVHSGQIRSATAVAAILWYETKMLNK